MAGMTIEPVFLQSGHRLKASHFSWFESLTLRGSLASDASVRTKLLKQTLMNTLETTQTCVLISPF